MATLSMGLLPRASAFVIQALREEEETLQQHRMVFSEVHQVLDEMVYDVETCEHECEVARLKHELQVAQSSVLEYQHRESVLIQERQQAFDYALAVEKEGQAIMVRLQDHLRVVMAELSMKEQLEKDLAQAHEQLRLSAQLSKELANAQREIRELHRKNSIQKLLKTSGVSSASAKSNGNGLSRAASSYVGSTQRLFASPASSPVAQVLSPSNQLETALENDALARCSDKVLMNVFAHLDANSVFAVNLTSRTMMTRVHTLFGMPPNSVMIKKSQPAVEPSQPASALKQGVMKARSQSSIVPGPSYSEKERAQRAKAAMIVKSLKKDEIKLFHDMSTRVKTLESHLSQVQAEKEDIAARLHSAESVRDFLMEKLKELEDRLSTMMEGQAKKEEQNAMDREIMGFLDARIQEYELTSKRLAKQNEELISELRRVRDEHEAKVTIVHDMVTLLSDEKRDLDTQLKSQRKVLVREVKALRSQNEQLTHEKERYFTQLKQLRHALQHLDDLG